MIVLPTFKSTIARGGSAAFDTDYQAVLTQATSLGYTLPDSIGQVAGNNFVLALKAAGIWSKLDAFWVYATTGDQNFASLNWKNPSLYQHTLSGTFSFRSKGGLTPSSATSHIVTNWNPSTNGVQYTQDNASRSVYVTTSSLASATPVSALDGNTTANVNSIRNVVTTAYRINSVTNGTANADLQGGGLKTINRVDASTINIYSGNTLILTDTANTSVTMTSSSQLVGRSGALYSTAEFGFYAVGSDLSSFNSQLVSAVKAYMAAINTTFDSDYQAVLTRATSLGYSLPSAYCQAIQNDMVVKLKTAGVWSKLDLLYVMDNDASTIDFATLNWKAPSSFQLTLVNSPTWLSGVGIQLSSTQYIDTNWNPTTNGVQYKLDDASACLRTIAMTGTSLFGTTLGTTGGLHLQTANTAAVYINTTNSLSTTDGGSTAHMFRSLVRSSSTNCEYRAIAASLTSVTNARTATSTAMPNNTVWIGRSGTIYGAGTYQYSYFGAYLTVAEMNSANAILMSSYEAV